jgi:hypothetical protein
MNEETDARKPEAERQFAPVSLLAGRVALRDYFAGMAMQGMMVEVNEPDCEWVARHSYAVADAMLARRKRKAS